MIKLKDFAYERGVTERAIQKHLKTYATELEGLYERKGPNGTWLSEEACEFLRGKMKTPPPPAVFDADPRVAELENKIKEIEQYAKEMWNQLKTKDATINMLVTENQRLHTEAASVARLTNDITEKDKTIQKQEDELKTVNLELSEALEANEKKDKRIQELENRTFGDYLKGLFRKKGKTDEKERTN